MRAGCKEQEIINTFPRRGSGMKGKGINQILTTAASYAAMDKLLYQIYCIIRDANIMIISIPVYYRNINI